MLDVYLTEELIGQEETVNDRGDLVIVENRERCFNIEVGDETGFTSHLQVPIQRNHQAIRAGDVAEMLILSNRSDLSRIGRTSDIYIPGNNIWVSDYPCLQREAFVEVSRQINAREEAARSDRRKRNNAQTDSAYPDNTRGGALAPRPRRRSRRNPSMDW